MNEDLGFLCLLIFVEQLLMLLVYFLSDCSRHLMEPELKLLGPASQALHALARGCDDASQTIATATVPLLLQQFTTRSAVRFIPSSMSP